MSAARIENMFEHVLPVVTGAMREVSGQRIFLLEPPHLLGSAFPIGQGRYLTAGHVVRDFPLQKIALGSIAAAEEQIRHLPMETCEIHRVEDVACLGTSQSRGEPERILPMGTTDELLPLLADVRACGFPLGMDPVEMMLSARAFKGHIVTASLVAGTYELSFPTPKGFSGAPLIGSDTGEVVGMILGTRSISMPLDAWVQTSDDGTQVIRHETEYVYQPGIALSSVALRQLHFDSLGGTVDAHVKRALTQAS